MLPELLPEHTTALGARETPETRSEEVASGRVGGWPRKEEEEETALLDSLVDRYLGNNCMLLTMREPGPAAFLIFVNLKCCDSFRLTTKEIITLRKPLVPCRCRDDLIAP